MPIWMNNNKLALYKTFISQNMSPHNSSHFSDHLECQVTVKCKRKK